VEGDSGAVAGELSRRRHRVGVKNLFFFLNFFYFSYVFKPPKPVFEVKISKKGLACPRSKDLKGKLLFVKPLVRFGSLTGPWICFWFCWNRVGCWLLIWWCLDRLWLMLRFCVFWNVLCTGFMVGNWFLLLMCFSGLFCRFMYFDWEVCDRVVCFCSCQDCGLLCVFLFLYVCCDCRFIYRRWCLGHQGLVFVGGEQNEAWQPVDSLCWAGVHSWTILDIKIKK